MQIHGTNNVHGAQALNGPHFRRPAAPAEGATPAQPADQLDISPEASEAARVSELADARAAEHVKDANGVRTGLVDRLRSQIAAGTYESADKLDAALNSLLDEIG
ncbi:hypothetical protein Pla108_28290 [Botrimarina colliarenosi]|uniref:Anti-sigma-28 factor FlgM C-terminal domain-containing protein n=1 Tax=Botrimarina colliarenosi TaxID=2528001 RepID=A0A5C6AAJ1_9BACT|nr:flagellar biosynthesis anti-sigma factor FlgM [Botrimarina colliarenosi]TWT97052.1 hypothetical protein Pla108_28290 [Botrimarina colliarenosi]